MIAIRSAEEIEIMRQGGKILARVLSMLADEVKPGVSLIKLNESAEREILNLGGRLSFKNYRPAGADKPYPAGVCVSLNHEVVHGVPDEKIIKQGDVVSLDLGVFYKGYHTDSAVTLAAGRASPQVQHLILVTKNALDLAINEIKSGVYWGDVAGLMQKYVESEKLSVVKELTGHGVGRNLQEDPVLPNYGRYGAGPMLETGMVLAVEPMVTVGRPEIELGADGFVYQTRDKSLAAHFEHTLAVTADGVDVLTKT